jgi:hypothetical protein
MTNNRLGLIHSIYMRYMGYRHLPRRPHSQRLCLPCQLHQNPKHTPTRLVPPSPHQ